MALEVNCDFTVHLLDGFSKGLYAWIGFKNHKHSVNNPYAQFQDEYTLDDILAAKMISDPLTKLQCSPTSDGSATAKRRSFWRCACSKTSR